MRSLDKLFQKISPRQLLNCVSRAAAVNRLPYYLMRVEERCSMVPQNCWLSVTRRLSNETLKGCSRPLTVWSPQHLQRIRETGVDQEGREVLLKNPFKSEELIEQCLSMEVSAMVVASIEEFTRVESFRKGKFENKALTYYWMAQDNLTNLEQMRMLSGRIGGLYIERGGTQTFRIDWLVRKALQAGVRLNRVVVEGGECELDNLRIWQRESLIFAGVQVEKIIDLSDFSDVGNYVLAARSMDRRRLVMDGQVEEFIQGLDCSRSSILIEYGNELWFLSEISQLPLDQERYVFDLGRNDAAGVGCPRALVY